MLFSYKSAYAMQSLSLKEAILLSLRNNPDVCQTKLENVLQKFAIELQQWQFKPHYNFNAVRTTTRTANATSDGAITTTQTGIQPGASWLTPYGTQLTFTATNNLTDHYNPGVSLQIVQPLIRGFGRSLVEIALRDALDQGKIGLLNQEQVIQQTITRVIHAWLEIILIEDTISLDRTMLQEAKKSLKQTRLFIKAGKKAAVEELSARAAVANAESILTNDVTQQDSARHILLMAIGLHPSTPITLKHTNIKNLINRYHSFTFNETKEQVLAHDPQYQIDQITLHGSTQRNLQQAKDQTRWQLNLTLIASSGNGSGGGRDAGFNSLVNGVNETSSASLNLNIPIDDQEAKMAVSSAKIAIKQAEIALREEKWQLETDAIDLLNNVNNAKNAIQLSANTASLEGESRKMTYSKYAAGLIDSLELQLSDQQYRNAKQLEVSNRIRYLHALADLDLLTGNTLTTWKI